ncbi:hypothetical protein GGTG_06927 [Gaeumannomyces tritici R3-111a-1]|uniref:Uncharacterized protein n=1 Tax=Gaeumannomyces tritici (strain R3-111a-1) TaxID=644352 RepID=J3P080_GAET3|nr:hypothetical protein GGTG_06927 [Gaeumannomyces tritici R3-111a-1]EJT77013.1 hypothetical protein GGTG_06927 [Gaeumannomyces tritici R3-111a-1]
MFPRFTSTSRLRDGAGGDAGVAEAVGGNVDGDGTGTGNPTCKGPIHSFTDVAGLKL